MANFFSTDLVKIGIYRSCTFQSFGRLFWLLLKLQWATFEPVFWDHHNFFLLLLIYLCLEEVTILLSCYGVVFHNLGETGKILIKGHRRALKDRNLANRCDLHVVTFFYEHFNYYLSVDCIILIVTGSAVLKCLLSTRYWNQKSNNP